MESVFGEDIAIFFDVFIMAGAVKNVRREIVARAVIAGEFVERRSRRAFVAEAMERNAFHIGVTREDAAHCFGVAMEVENDWLVEREIVVKVARFSLPVVVPMAP